MPRTKKAIPTAVFAVASLAAGALVLGSPAFAAGVPAPAAGPHAAAAGYAYRHGLVPRLDAQFRAHHPAAQTATTRATANLYYHGGTNGVGVTTGAPKVYIVYWGSQWGYSNTDSSGDLEFSGDPAGMAPYQQEFFKGLGTGGELWSGVMTQYCEGIPAGSSRCTSANPHVGYPTGGALAGVWYDSSAAAPDSATGHDLAEEAIKAAAYFGNTTPDSQRNVQYVITSPTGTNPDNYQSPTTGYCAYHDFTGDPTMSGGPVSSPYGDLAWTNMPYLVDVGSTCGAGFVNPGNNLDGVSIVGGHEFAETVTDQFPYQPDASANDISTGGWTNGASEGENGDLCAWVSSGSGRSRDLSLTTGTFAVQTTWGNDTHSCQFSHSIVTGSN